jgi:hypothetical protein
MDIKIFIKSLSDSEHEELIKYITNHNRFEAIIIQKARNYNSILVIDWVENFWAGKDMSVRLFNGLKSIYLPCYAKNNGLEFTKLAEVKREHFNLSRNLGDKSWEEFKQLRGY